MYTIISTFKSIDESYKIILMHSNVEKGYIQEIIFYNFNDCYSESKPILILYQVFVYIF